MAVPALARRSEAFDFGVRTVELMLTTGCNFRCAYCYQQPKARRTMTPGVLDAGIRQLVSSRLRRPTLSFYGGEPLLAVPLIRRALQRVRDWAPTPMTPEIQIVTNGSRLDEEMIRLLIARNVFIMLSFDGIAPAQGDRSPGSFEILDQLLLRLRRDHPEHFRGRFAVKVTLTSRNVPFLSASFGYFLSRGVRQVDIYPVLPDDTGWGEPSRRELNRQLAEVVRLSVEEFRRSNEVPFSAFRGAAASAAGTPACACASRGLLFVDVDGAVAPCSVLARSTLGSPPTAIRHVVEKLGGIHVTNPDLSGALARREKLARRLRFLAGSEARRGPKGPCATCKARPTCFVCPVSVAAGGCVPTFHCDVNRLLARHRASFHRLLRETPAAAESLALHSSLLVSGYSASPKSTDGRESAGS